MESILGTAGIITYLAGALFFTGYYEKRLQKSKNGCSRHDDVVIAMIVGVF